MWLNDAKRLVNRFDVAAQDKAMMGAAHPDSWEEIEHEYNAAKKDLLLALTTSIRVKSGSI
jgi:hypothetical protein